MFLKKVSAWFYQKYKSSAFCSLILKIKSAWKDSFFYAVLSLDSGSMYEKSYFYSLASCLFSKLTSFFKVLYEKISNYNKNSLNYNLHGRLKEKKWFCFEYFCAAFFFLIMIIPHNLWNNFVAVIGALMLGGISLIIRLNAKVDKAPVSVWLVTFILAVIGGVFITPDRADGVRAMLFILSAIVFMEIVRKTDEEHILINIIKFLISALFLMCIYAVYQRIEGVQVQELLTDVTNNKGMPGRVYSTFENPNNFAEVIVLLMPFIYALFIISDRKVTKLCYVVVFAVCLAALMLTYSRSCYVSFAISAVVFVLFYKPKLIIPLLFAAIVMVPFLPESVTNRILTIASTSDTSNAYRIYLWGGVWEMLKNHWVSGVGTGSAAFIKAYAPFASPLAANAPHSHMLYLELFIEFGIVGGVSFFAFWLSSIRKGIFAIGGEDKNLRCIIIAAISSFAGISFASAAEYIWFYPRVMYIFFIVLGILLCSIRLNKKAR